MCSGGRGSGSQIRRGTAEIAREAASCLHDLQEVHRQEEDEKFEEMKPCCDLLSSTDYQAKPRQ